MCSYPSHSQNPLHSLGPRSLLNTQTKWTRSYFLNHNYPNPVLFSLLFPSIQFESLKFCVGQKRLPRSRVFFLAVVWRPSGKVQGQSLASTFSTYEATCQDRIPSLHPKDLPSMTCRGLKREIRLSSLLVSWNYPNGSSPMLGLSGSSGPQHVLGIRSHHYQRDLDWTEHLKVDVCHKDSELAPLRFICALIRSVSCFQV